MRRGFPGSYTGPPQISGCSRKEDCKVRVAQSPKSERLAKFEIFLERGRRAKKLLAVEREFFSL